MVSLPVQHAMVAALSDSKHVVEQRGRYNSRRARLVPALVSAGFTIDHSDAGLYIWATRNESSWDSVAWLAALGVLATPGIFMAKREKTIFVLHSPLQINRLQQRQNEYLRKSVRVNGCRNFIGRRSWDTP